MHGSRKYLLYTPHAWKVYRNYKGVGGHNKAKSLKGKVKKLILRRVTVFKPENIVCRGYGYFPPQHNVYEIPRIISNA